ncbi:MAG: hypothetical protein GY737_31330 [Desulfobacteraceae bacterium]|nr:hypothetical protein [Desulfobacteraceae bacterium]
MKIHSLQAKNSPNDAFSRGSFQSDRFRAMLADKVESLDSLGAVNKQASEKGLLSLGTVTREVPTVSELLYASPYKKECWRILSKRENIGKAYKNIPPGTEIFLDPATEELVWKGNGRKTQSVEQAGPMEPVSPQPLDAVGGSRLTTAVRSFLGKEYDQMDCYELVVGGLRSMGVQYRGDGGLGRHLMEKAVTNGYAYNHYLNGEGLVAASGRNLYQKRIFKINNAEPEADKIMAEMTPYLRDGQILSFSTRTRGHTGVVSKINDVWTFINSGDMDNNLAGANGKKAVGEETLKAEIRNWFSLAHRRGEGLKLSLGAMDMEKLARFGSKRGGVTEKV